MRFLHSRYLLACFCLAFFAAPASPCFSATGRSTVGYGRAVAASLPEEARAMWVVRYSLLKPAQVHSIVERASRYHFNALMVQIRGRGDAYYDSDIEPRATALAEGPAGFDPLAQFVTEAHQRGIKVFAWVDTMLVWTGARPPAAPNHVVNLHPDWVDAHASGTPMPGTEYEGQFLNPGIAAVRRYTVSIMQDIVRHYDVDGIHLDYIRYPGPGLGYNFECLAGFWDSLHPGDPTPGRSEMVAETRRYPAAWTRWRQSQVTELVREIRQGVQAIKPQASISAAVWSDLDDARYNRMQDWPIWLKDGIVDFVCPMAYSTNTARVVSQIRDAIRLKNGRGIWAGLGAWQMSPGQTIAKIDRVRELGVDGICLFSYGGMTSDGERERYLAALENGAFRRPASFPEMPWLSESDGVVTAQLDRSRH